MQSDILIGFQKGGILSVFRIIMVKVSPDWFSLAYIYNGRFLECHLNQDQCGNFYFQRNHSFPFR
ncbi:hypothetical protein CN378_06395 [Bacillus sp. AFS015802]|nr:hypothetical protein CN378_06395 [Bacillus sp. AFS015802]